MSSLQKVEVQAQEHIEFFGFTDKVDSSFEDREQFSITDALYLMRLCQFENDYARKISRLNVLQQKRGDGARFVDFKEAAIHP
mmetsp:Transcript_20018/g.30796  ORF Transcript_20018/g.30796 Transcript_20018/m.30796 type:complete len:83 (+) Transcript_20018:1243-1491(+)